MEGEPRKSLMQRIEDGETVWAGNYNSISPNLELDPYTREFLEERFGADCIELGRAYSEKLGEIHTMPGRLGVYVTKKAYEAYVESLN